MELAFKVFVSCMVHHVKIVECFVSEDQEHINHIEAAIHMTNRHYCIRILGYVGLDS